MSMTGDIIPLFRASEAPWVHPVQENCYVTDGPFLFRTDSNELLMLWSSHGAEGYAMGIARSQSGEIFGPWVQEPVPLYKKDGGHGMLFRTFDSRSMITIHSPNSQPFERPVIMEINPV